MADADRLELLRQGVDAWNAWRAKEPSAKPDLSGAYLCEMSLFRVNLSEANLSRALLREANLSRALLREANLSQADLRGANLRGANLREANLRGANLPGLDLRGANFRWANLRGANLRGANLRGANLVWANLVKAGLSEANLGQADLRGANLTWAHLRGANLVEANLAYASLVDADLRCAYLTGCRIYGVSAWGLKLSEETEQRNLIIMRSRGEPEITVDNIEVAQFIYLLLYNQKIRDVIDTITSKAVLILGRFTQERKQVLDALRDELRERNYVPIVFDFDKPASRTTDETITLLARMARFVIADLSDAKSILQELRGIVPDLPSVAVQPLILIPQEEPGMFDFIRKYPWVLEPYRYDNQEHLLANLDRSVVDPAEAKVLELRGTKPE
jgi:uncharacterized protein YjbI with pentapeptide repeats